jgi:hypothetical protein
LEQQKAYSNGKYAGSAWQVLTKYRFENNKLKLNLTYEKDAGEQYWDAVHKQPEYLSGSLLLQRLTHCRIGPAALAATLKRHSAKPAETGAECALRQHVKFSCMPARHRSAPCAG